MQFQIKKQSLGAPRLLHVDAPPAMSRNLFRRALMGALTFLLLFQMQTVSAQTPQSLLNSWNSNGSEPGCEQWKITFPTGDEEKDLCNNVASNRQEFYYVNSAGNGIVFRTPIRDNNGTTPNSDNVRCELRERETDGSSDVEWTTSGQHVIYVKQAITHLPIQKDELVATQIHGDKAAGIDDAMVLRLEGSNLFLSFNGNVLRSNVAIKSNYSLGQVHEVIFQVIDGKHYCYYSEDGNLKNAFSNGNADNYLVKDGNNPVLMDIDYDQAYFKAGNYTQSNPGDEGSSTNNSNNYGEVVIYDLIVDHDGDFGSIPGGGGSCSAVVPSSRTVSNVGQTSATVRWSYSSSFNHYNVRYRKTGTSSWSYLTSLRLSEGEFSVSNNIASKTITGLSSNTTYEWQVRAKCDDSSIATSYASGAGPNFTTSSSGSSCSAIVPSSRTVSNVGQTSATVRWSYSSSFNHYNVRYRKTGTSSWSYLTSLRLSEGEFSVSNNIASRTLTGLSNSTTYEWQVRAKCDDSSIATSYASGAGPNFTTSGSGTWTPDPNKNYYIDVPHHNRRIAAASGGARPYMTSTGSTGSDVEWKFVAKGNGSWHIRRAAGGSTPGLRVLNSGGTADMQATSSSGVYTYYEFTTGSISGTYYATLPDVSFSNDRLQVDRDDNISFVPSANHAGTWESLKFTEVGSSNRAAVTETPDDASTAVTDTGIGSIEDAGNLSFWPNPSGGEITILVPTGNTQRTTSVTISDLLGRTVIQRTGLKAGDSFDISEPLSKGTYILRWLDEDGQVLQVDKMIRQ